MSTALLIRLRAVLSKAADPARAPAMQAYMKSNLPYLGISLPVTRSIARSVFAQIEIPSASQWQGDALDLWRSADYREERYSAIFLTGDQRAEEFQTFAVLPMYEEMITTGAWWDYVDAISLHQIGSLLLRESEPMRIAMREWSRSDNLWKRRASIICQLSFKEHTDLELLYACISPSLGSSEFFLRKAIGWALRQYARTDPEEVLRYVNAHQHDLSSLSKREALKHIRDLGVASSARHPSL